MDQNFPLHLNFRNSPRNKNNTLNGNVAANFKVEKEACINMLCELSERASFYRRRLLQLGMPLVRQF